MTATTASLAVTRMEGMEVYQIGREAMITLQPSTGYVAVHCPFHDELNGCCFWSHRGDELTLKQFLLQLNKEYAIDRLFSPKLFQDKRCATWFWDTVWAAFMDYLRAEAKS